MLKFILLLYSFVSVCCDHSQIWDQEKLSAEFKKYWYNNEAEINSYQLNQARYGELREGKAVLIYVTEPFSPSQMVKSDDPDKMDVSVLKLNSTKNFTTGIYPYSMMSSSFTPVEEPQSCLKLTVSSQEWCGHTYTELLNQKGYNITTHSYFQGESGQKRLEKVWLEDHIWSLIRIDPSKIPIGNIEMIPSFFYLRLSHSELKKYKAELSKTITDKSSILMTIRYPELERNISIEYESKFPFRIISWKEDYYDGRGDKKNLLITSAQLIKSIKSDYWKKNTNADEYLRNEIGLK